jgi:DNA replication licensing factor MCM2
MRHERLQLKMKAGADFERRDEGMDLMEEVLDFEDVKGRLSTWLAKPEVVRWVQKLFASFLRSYKDDNGVHVYEERIKEMCENNKQSLEITFLHLSSKYPTIAIWLAEEPTLVLPILNDVALSLTLEMFSDYD